MPLGACIHQHPQSMAEMWSVLIEILMIIPSTRRNRSFGAQGIVMHIMECNYNAHLSIL